LKSTVITSRHDWLSQEPLPETTYYKKMKALTMNKINGRNQAENDYFACQNLCVAVAYAATKNAWELTSDPSHTERQELIKLFSQMANWNVLWSELLASQVV